MPTRAEALRALKPQLVADLTLYRPPKAARVLRSNPAMAVLVRFLRWRR
jgi:hypothetical protein